MTMNAATLCDLLARRHNLERCGQGLGDTCLQPPLLYVEGMRPRDGQVLVMRTQDLPAGSHARCLYVCVGGKAPRGCSRWMGEVVRLGGDGLDLLSAFNEVQQVFTDVSAWERQLADMASSGAVLSDMVRASLPVFGNRITIVDYDLRMLVACAPLPDGGYEVLDGGDDAEPIPSDIAATFTTQRPGSISARNPYFIEGEKMGRNYCVNLFLGETYVGSCSLHEERHVLGESDQELFQVFSRHVRQRMALRGDLPARASVGLRTVLEQLLEAYPVSKRDMRRAIELKELSLGVEGLSECRWFCSVARSMGRSKVLSEQYLLDTFEREMPHVTAVMFEGSVVVLCPLEKDEHRADVLASCLRPLLQDLHLQAGVSRTFLDLFHARDYYLQACCALETGIESGEEDACHLFGNNVLAFMLQNACGDFGSEMVVTPALVRLARKSEQGVDYLQTLRCYLDNECSATRTARKLYVHRSTLMDRLRRIERFVDLSTPEKRLYLRMCLALEDTGWMGNPDVAD